MATGVNTFQRLSQEVSSNIYKISNNVSQLQSLQKQLLSGSTDVSLKNKFHDLQHYTHQLVTETSSKIKDLTNYQGSDVDQRTQKFQRERLLNEFAKILNTFQTIQRQEKEYEKQVIKSRVSNPFDDDASFSVQYDNRDHQEHQIIQIDASDVDVEILRERDDALLKLESDISDVNQIFKDLSVLVHQQGEVIDTIEDNAVSAAANVDHGAEQLQKARNSANRARKFKCGIISIVLLIVIIVIIVLVIELRK